jgi:hypothetical protein
LRKTPIFKPKIGKNRRKIVTITSIPEGLHATHEKVVEPLAAALLHAFEAELDVEREVVAGLLERFNGVQPAQNLADKKA